MSEPAESPERTTQPLPRTRGSLRGIVATLVAVIFLLAMTGSALFFLHGAAQTTLDRARADVDRTQSLVGASSAELTRARKAFDDVTVSYNAELTGNNGNGALGGGPAAQRLQGQRDRAQAEFDDATRVSKQRNDQLNTVINARTSAEQSLRTWPTAWVVYGILTIALMLMFGIWWLYQRSETIRESEDGNALDRVRQALVETKDGDVGSLSWSNQTMLQEYHGIVLRSAKSARGLTVAVLVLGFLLVTVLGVAAVFVVDGVPGTIAASVVTAAGAAVTGYITRAVLRNAENSAREVGRFFDHPRQLERVLAAERVLATISAEKGDEARLEVVRALVAPTSEN